MKKLYLLIFVMLLLSCSQRQEEVVIYTSLDQVFSQPILEDFQKETGIKVRAVYDLEATKTTGMVNRLIAEKDNPQADVFWNSEIVRTIVLKNKGVLQPYFSPSSKDIPDKFKDSDGFWTGFAARARVFICNTELLQDGEEPTSIFELDDPQWKGKVALAFPLFGTTSTHAASLFVKMGNPKAEVFFRSLKANDIVIVDGNSVSRDRVQAGEIPVGFTDTDDANVSIVNKHQVKIIYPDQGEEQIGTLFIPNTVALIKDAPNIHNAKKLIDYLLSKKVESNLAFADSAQIPLRSGVPKPSHVVSASDIKTMDVDFNLVAERIEMTSKILQKIFVR